MLNRDLPFIILLSIFCTLSQAQAAGQANITIAVLNLEAIGVEDNTSGVISEMVRTTLGNEDEFIILSHHQLEKIARHNFIKLSDCNDVVGAIRIGKASKAKVVITGSLSKLGMKYILSLRALNVVTGSVECDAHEEGEVRVEDLSSLVLPAVRKIVASLLNKPIPPESIDIMKASPLYVPHAENIDYPGLTYLRTNDWEYKEYLNSKDSSTMIFIPAGEFTMGSKNIIAYNIIILEKMVTWPNEQPIHSVYLGQYFISKYEVTVGQFRNFCNSTGKDMPGQPTWGQDNYPVSNMTWDDAVAYAAWAGLRLPTEAEWEKAARGTDERLYPWGNKWDPTKCNAHGNSDWNEHSAPIGRFPQGASPYGAMDMAGNVWEWCQDWLDDNYYSISPDSNPKGPSSGYYRVMRGGSWSRDRAGTKTVCRTSGRGKEFPEIKFANYGFRCVR